jgi:hypothetical protein
VALFSYSGDFRTERNAGLLVSHSKHGGFSASIDCIYFLELLVFGKHGLPFDDFIITFCYSMSLSSAFVTDPSLQMCF